MPVSPDLIERSGDLKRQLVEFAHSARMKRALRQATKQRFGPVGEADEGEFINFVDHFILQHHLADGRTVVEHFVDAHPELSAAERELLLGWRDVVESFFAVERRDGDALIMTNLVDDLTCRSTPIWDPGSGSGRRRGPS